MLCVSCCFFIFFFFQAEDGIRDLYVTGVQTCALPIYDDEEPARRIAVQPIEIDERDPHHRERTIVQRGLAVGALIIGGKRSEERRVGKECRERGGAGE